MICPQLANPVDLGQVGRFVHDDGWVAEQKIDGHRLMLVSPGTDQMRAVTRDGTRYTHRLPREIEKLRLPEEVGAADFVLDGELIRGEYWLFDFLLADGSFNRTPLTERRTALEAFCRLGGPFRLVPQARTTEEKTTLLYTAAEQHYEGVVFKRASAGYLCGRRSHDWLKAKFVATADVVVLEVNRKGKASARLGIYRDGQPVEVGSCSLHGKPPVKPGDVICVCYLYVQDAKSPRLYQPRMIGDVRTDKQAHECNGSDFVVTNKSVLPAIEEIR